MSWGRPESSEVGTGTLRGKTRGDGITTVRLKAKKRTMTKKDMLALLMMVATVIISFYEVCLFPCVLRKIQP